MDTDGPDGGPQHRAEQCQPDGVADDLDGEGLGRGAGDGEIRHDDLGQPGDLLDVDLDEVPG